jgi:hypothetical protein
METRALSPSMASTNSSTGKGGGKGNGHLLVPSLCTLMRSAASPRLVRNTAIDLLTGSCTDENVGTEFLDACAKHLDEFIETFLEYQAAPFSDIYRAEQLLLAVQSFTLAGGASLEGVVKVNSVLAVIDKVLQFKGIESVSTPLIVARFVATMLEHCDTIMTAWDHDKSEQICIASKTASVLWAHCIQCLHGGAKQEIRDKILVILKQLFSFPCLSSAWTLEYPETSRSTQPTKVPPERESTGGKFLMLVSSICRGEIHLLFEEAMYLAAVGSTVGDVQLSGEQLQLRIDRFNAVAPAVAELLTKISQIMISLLENDNNCSPLKGNNGVSRVGPTEAIGAAEIPAEAILYIRDELHKFVGDFLEFVKEMSTVGARENRGMLTNFSFEHSALLKAASSVADFACSIVSEDDTLQDTILEYLAHFVTLSKHAGGDAHLLDAIVPVLLDIYSNDDGAGEEDSKIDRMCVKGLVALLFEKVGWFLESFQSSHIDSIICEAGSGLFASLSAYLQLLSALLSAKESDLSILSSSEGFDAFQHVLGIEEPYTNIPKYRSLMQSVGSCLVQVRSRLKSPSKGVQWREDMGQMIDLSITLTGEDILPVLSLE